MNKPARPLGMPWTVAKVRWLLFISAFLLCYGFAPDASLDDLLSLGGVALVYAATLTLLALLRIHLDFVAVMATALDMLFIWALIAVSGWESSPAYYMPLALVVLAGIRHKLRGGLMATIAVALFWGYVRWPTPGAAHLIDVTLATLVMVAAVALSRADHARAERREAEAEERFKLAGEQVQAIYELTGNLTAALSYDKVLATILDVANMGLAEIGGLDGALTGIVLVFDAEGDDPDLLQVAAARGLTEEELALAFTGREGILGAVLGAVEPQLADNVSKDPELGRLSSLRGAKSVVAIPMRAGFDLFGVMVFGVKRKQAFGFQQMAFLRTLCNQATIALQNARFYEQLEAERARIIDSEEQVRHWLARELHDGPTQTMSAVAMRLNYVRQLLEKDPERADRELGTLEQMSRRATREIRTTLFKLRPLALESSGLRGALEQYAKRLEDEGGPTLKIDMEDPAQRLEPNVETTLFSIIEEAVNNARKHAQSDTISVRLGSYDDVYVAAVRDNGKGFDLEAVEGSYDKRGSLGLLNMKERAALLGGRLDIESRPGYGTVVTVAVPFVHGE